MLKKELREEIGKWTARLDNALSTTHAIGERGEKMLGNIKAYRKDSKHFLERGDLIKSFECLIWAWAILELGKELELFRTGPLEIRHHLRDDKAYARQLRRCS